MGVGFDPRAFMGANLTPPDPTRMWTTINGELVPVPEQLINTVNQGARSPEEAQQIYEQILRANAGVSDPGNQGEMEFAPSPPMGGRPLPGEGTSNLGPFPGSPEHVAGIPQTPEQLAKQFVNTIAAQTFAGPQAGPGMSYDEQKMADRKAALGRIADTRALQRLMRPPMPPSVFEQAQQQVVQGTLGMLGNVFNSMGNAPVQPQIVLGGGGGGGVGRYWRQPQQPQQPKQPSFKEVSDADLGWASHQLKTRIAALDEQIAGTRNGNRKDALRLQRDKLAQQAAQFDAEMTARNRGLENQERRTDIAASAQQSKEEKDKAAAAAKETQNFQARLDAIVSPKNMMGVPIGITKTIAVPQLEILLIELEAAGDTTRAGIVKKIIERINKIPDTIGDKVANKLSPPAEQGQPTQPTPATAEQTTPYVNPSNPGQMTIGGLRK